MFLILLVIILYYSALKKYFGNFSLQNFRIIANEWEYDNDKGKIRQQIFLNFFPADNHSLSRVEK